MAASVYGEGTKLGIKVIHNDGNSLNFRRENLLIDDLPVCGSDIKQRSRPVNPKGILNYVLSPNEQWFSIQSWVNTPIDRYFISNHLRVGVKNGSGMIGMVSVYEGKKNAGKMIPKEPNVYIGGYNCKLLYFVVRMFILPEDYEPLAPLEWYEIQFKDGNKMNIRPDNLEVFYPCKDLREHSFITPNKRYRDCA